MRRRARVRRRSDFQSAIGGRRFHSGRALVGFAVATGLAGTRVGVTVSRTVKGAVARNRARRRVREAARTDLLGPDSPLRQVGIRYDVILIAQRRALDMPFDELKAEMSTVALRLAQTKPETKP